LVGVSAVAASERMNLAKWTFFWLKTVPAIFG
jgi:hypothetical protein